MGGTLLIAALIILCLAVWTSWDLYSFAAVVWGFPLIALGFGLLLLAASGLRIRVPGAVGFQSGGQSGWILRTC